MKDVARDLKFFLILGVISLFLFSFDKLGFLKFPKLLLQTVTVPIEFGVYKSGTAIGKQFEFLWLSRVASLENKALRLQMGEILSENANLRKKLAESEILIDSYNKLSPQTYDLQPARIIGISRFLTLDKGESDGLKVGQPIAFKDQYLGQIKNVTTKFSEALLLTDPDSKIAVFSQGTDGRAKGILQGQFRSELLMDKILHQEKISVGDLVYSEGTEGKLPRGLLMGKVTQVYERENEIFKQAKIEPLFKVTDLDLVFVILNQ